MDFAQGDAENLAFDDQSSDAVINVEASHCYSRFPRFLAEVARVLRPGGHFLYTDLRPRSFIAEWESALADAPIRLLSQADINAQILRGWEESFPPIQVLFSGHAPPFFRRLRDALGVSASKVRDALQSGEFSYRMYHFTND